MSEANYDLQTSGAGKLVEAPTVPYRPREPCHYRPKIAVVGCGGITETHLQAYREAKYDVAVLCSRERSRAEKYRDQFFAQALVTDRFEDVLARDDIDVIDLTAHAEPRGAQIEACLNAQKHVLSQKPLVLDLEQGSRLVELAETNGVKLAVNQNGRWAPHFSYLREAVRAGHIGDVTAIRQSVHWDHNWIAGMKFDEMPHVILFDFGIHWFDFVASLMEGRKATRVYASVQRTSSQKARPPLVAQAVIDYEGAQVTLGFDADSPHATEDRTWVQGTKGAMRSVGPSLTDQEVTMWTEKGMCCPQLEGSWFPGGFHGAMAELLCAIEEKREPLHGARVNLESLRLAFAAMKSADEGGIVTP